MPNFGAIVVLNCETDFVAKNENFISFTTRILDIAMEAKPESLDALKELMMDGRSIVNM
jgi:elongation factor Ts